MFSSRISARFAPTRYRATNASPRRMFVATRISPPVDAVDVDAGDRREQHRRHEERQDQQADRGVRLGRVDDDDGQPEQDHVAADLGRRLRQPEAQERAVAEDGEGALARWGLVGRGLAGLGGRQGALGRRHAGGPGRTGVTAAVSAGSPRSTNPASRRSSVGRSRRTWRPQASAAQPDVGAEPVDEPRVAAARVGPAQADDVAEEQLEHGVVGHPAGQGIKAAGGRGPARGSRSVAGSSSRSTGVTVTTTSGWVAASWAMIPPDRVSEPVSLSGAPMASSSNASPSGTPSTVTAPGRAGHDHARHEPHAGDRDRLGAGVAQLVDQLLDAGPVDRAADRDGHAGAGRPGRARRRPGRGGGRRGSRRPTASPRAWPFGERRELALERGDLAAQLVVAGVEVGHEDRQVLRRQLREAASSRPGPAAGRRRAARARTPPPRSSAGCVARASSSAARTGGRDQRRSGRRGRDRPRVAQRHRPGERRHVDRLRLGERDPDAVPLGARPHEVDEPGRRAQPVVQVVRADGRDLVRRREVGRVDQQRSSRCR